MLEDNFAIAGFMAVELKARLVCDQRLRGRLALDERQLACRPALEQSLACGSGQHDRSPARPGTGADGSAAGEGRSSSSASSTREASAASWPKIASFAVTGTFWHALGAR